MPTAKGPATVSLDAVARSVVRRSGLRFAVASDAAAISAALGLRADAAAEHGWPGEDRDAYDERAVHVVGWDGQEPVAAARIVFPPGPLPTEEACHLAIPPQGAVADVGRMVVARAHQQFGHGGFVALLAALYLEGRAGGLRVACGMMAPNVRGLTRFLGLRLELLGPDREYLGELRAPVRFDLERNFATLEARWPESDGED
jgi:GNAT superfamily N-acetyltransferase